MEENTAQTSNAAQDTQPPQVVQQPTPPSPNSNLPASESVPNKPKSKKKFVITGLIILALLLAAGSAFAAYHYMQKPPKQEGNKITKIPTTTPVLTSDWKTYTNTQYGFEFKYPQTLRLGTNSDNNFISFFENSGMNSLQRLVIFVVDNPNDLSLKNFAEADKSIPDERKNVSYDNHQTNGYNTLITHYEKTCIGICKYVKTEKYFTESLKSKKEVIIFSVGTTNPAGNTKDDEKFIDQILSTFKFTQTQNTTSDFNSEYFIWNVSDNKLPDTTLQQIKTAFMNFIPPGAGEGVLKGRKIEITGFDTTSTSANMVFASTMLVDQNKQPVPVDTAEYMLVNKNNAWEIISADNNEFCSNLRNAPEDLLSGFRRLYYGNCFVPQSGEN